MAVGPTPGNDRARAAQRLAVWFVAAIVGSSLLVEAGWIAVHDTRPVWGRDVYYSVFVHAPAANHFTAVVPGLVLADGTPASLFGGRHGTEGEVVSVQSVETEHGPGLMIVGSGEIRFWAMVDPPDTVQPPATYSTRNPGGNLDFGMWTPDPPHWDSRVGQSLGHVWINVTADPSQTELRVSVHLSFPVDCAYHSASMDTWWYRGWIVGEVETRQGCPVA